MNPPLHKFWLRTNLFRQSSLSSVRSGQGRCLKNVVGPRRVVCQGTSEMKFFATEARSTISFSTDDSLFLQTVLEVRHTDGQAMDALAVRGR